MPQLKPVPHVAELSKFLSGAGISHELIAQGHGVSIDHLSPNNTAAILDLGVKLDGGSLLSVYPEKRQERLLLIAARKFKPNEKRVVVHASDFEWVTEPKQLDGKKAGVYPTRLNIVYTDDKTSSGYSWHFS